MSVYYFKWEQSGGGHRNSSSVQTSCSFLSDHDAAALITEQLWPEKLCISLFFYKVIIIIILLDTGFHCGQGEQA